MVSFDFLDRCAFSKTKLDYLIRYLYGSAHLPLFEILSIRSVSSSFTDFENFEFVYEVVYLDDFGERNYIRVVLFPSFDDCFFEEVFQRD